MKNETVEINCFKQLIEFVGDRLTCGHWLFRGHGSSSWDLTPNIARDLDKVEQESVKTPEGRLVVDERLYLEELQMLQQTTGTSLNQELSEFSHINQLLKAQHHGAKTRLLDWTSSLLVAAYFASRTQKTKSDFAIFAVHCCPYGAGGTYLTPQYFADYDFYKGYLTRDDYNKPVSKNTISKFVKAQGPVFIRGSEISPRVLAQQGFVSLQPWLTAPLNADSSLSVGNCFKITIAGNARKEFQDRIYQLGMRHQSLFPDDDGKFRGYHEDREIYENLIGQCGL